MIKVAKYGHPVNMETKNVTKKEKVRVIFFQVRLSPSKKVSSICYNESPLKMMKNVFISC